MFHKWKKATHLDHHRGKIKEELYTFKRTVEHGFPYRPSSFDYDPILKLMGVGTKNGIVKIFGSPGVQFIGIHPEVNKVLQIHFLHGTGQLVTILDDNTLHLWGLSCVQSNQQEAQELIEIRASQLSERPGINQITEAVVQSTNDVIWLGTEGGSIYSLSLPDFESRENATILQDKVMQSVPDKCQSGKTLGPVEAIVEHPVNPSLLLIGYNRGLIVLWNHTEEIVESYYLSKKALESLSWDSNSKEFMSAHIDGSLCTWSVESQTSSTSHIPYGPFPCRSITKLMWLSSRAGSYTIFSGGMPRANYGDRYCVSVVQDSKHVTFDFTSRVIDFFVICKNKRNADWEMPEFLVVLVEEELVAIDLTQENWPYLKAPYLLSPHSSAITSSIVVDDISEELWNKLQIAAETKLNSTASWPITGGIDLVETQSNIHSVLITGHEDGSIKMWDVSGIAMTLILKIQTDRFFVNNASDAEDENNFEEQFPPFRKVGEFDPYSDDPRLTIRKVTMCQTTGTLVAGGSAGQVMIFVLSSEVLESLITRSLVDVLEGRTDFMQKDIEQLQINDQRITMQPGYQVCNIVQCQPPGIITSVSVHSNWGLVGVGTRHGFLAFDYMLNRSVLSRCTHVNGGHVPMEGNFSRAKSFKKSLRQSVRRIRGSFKGGRRDSVRKQASGRQRNGREDATDQKLEEANAALVNEDKTVPGTDRSLGATEHRKIEARSSKDEMTDPIRCTCFANTYFRDGISIGPTFWVGTNCGAVFGYALHVPDYSLRQNHEVTSIIGKHIQLKHGAPVMDITVLDSQGVPLHSAPTSANGNPINLNNNGPISQTGVAHHHSLIISSEEQMKVFTLPKITAKRKLKLTAVDGSLVRKVVFARFVSSKNPEYHEYNLVCLTNLGKVHIFAQLPLLRIQETYQCISQHLSLALASAILTSGGQGFNLLSPSEYAQFTLSAARVTEPVCRVLTKLGRQVESVDEFTQGKVQVVVEDNIITHLNENNSSKSGYEILPEVDVATQPTSPNTTLLHHDDDDDDDDERHVVHHESVLEEAERILVAAGGDMSMGVSDSEDIDIQGLLGSVAEAERLLNKVKA